MIDVTLWGPLVTEAISGSTTNNIMMLQINVCMPPWLWEIISVKQFLYVRVSFDFDPLVFWIEFIELSTFVKKVS